MTTYSDVLMKKDLYHEYKQAIDRYKPIEEVKKEMFKNSLKYVLQSYLRVRNLCDQGIDDPDDVADILNIPTYLAEDLVSEYYLIPEKFDQRKVMFSRNFSDKDERLKFLEGQPILIYPKEYLDDPDNINKSAYDCAYYVGFLTFYYFGKSSIVRQEFSFKKPVGSFDDDSNIYWKAKGENFRLGFNLAFDQMPEICKHVSWVKNFYSYLVSLSNSEHPEQDLDRTLEKSAPNNLEKLFPGYKPDEKKKVVFEESDFKDSLC